MSVTINDVAKMAGVSKSTVSKVINDSPTISAPTKEKVKRIMKELNYYPNLIARNLVQQSSNNIGVLMELKKGYAFMAPHVYEVLGGVEEVVHQNGYHLTLFDINTIFNNINALEKMILEKRVDGLIIHLASINKDIIDKLEKLQFPYIVIGQPNFDSNICWIDINNISAGEIAAAHLLNEGYNRIAYIGGTSKDTISAKRQTGYKNAVQSHNEKLIREYIKEGDSSSEDSFRLMNELLDLDHRPDSVICSSNFVAFGAVQAIKKRNLKIPKDIALVSFDNYPLAQYIDPPLSIVNIDVFELGVHAANTLMNKIKYPNLQVQHSMLAPSLVVRESSLKKKQDP